MAQEIRVVYKDSDKSVVGFIDSEITYENEIQPTLEKDGLKVATEILSFEDDVVIINDLLFVNSEGVASIQENNKNDIKRNGMKMKLVNDQFGNMDYDTWYLLPEAYSLTLTKTQTKRKQAGFLGKIFGTKP